MSLSETLLKKYSADVVNVFNMSSVLYEYDPANTCCKENKCLDEYDTIASKVIDKFRDAKIELNSPVEFVPKFAKIIADVIETEMDTIVSLDVLENVYIEFLVKA